MTTDKAEQDLNPFGQPRIRSRYGPQTTAAEVLEGVDLAGRNAIVTGGAGGIGYEIVRALAGAGAAVTIADVDEPAGEGAVARLNTETGADRVTFARLDLASLSQCAAFADEVVAAGKPLDILINNAGVMAPPLGRTAEGHELQFGVNHLGHYRMTLGLLPALRMAERARVVCVSSIAHRHSDIRYDDPDYLHSPYDRWQAYGQSKTACALFAIALNARTRDEGIFVNTMNPGGSMTGLQRHVTEQESIDLGWVDADGNVNKRWRTPEECAATPVWLVTSPEIDGVGGRYFEACNESAAWHADLPMNGVLPHINPDNAERLWELSERMVGG